MACPQVRAGSRLPRRAEPAGEHVGEYNRHYTEAERARVDKLIRAMQFANYWNNTFGERPGERSARVSRYPAASGPRAHPPDGPGPLIRITGPLPAEKLFGKNRHLSYHRPGPRRRALRTHTMRLEIPK